MAQADLQNLVKTFESRDKWQAAAVEAVYKWVLSYDNEVTIGLSGGSTPGPIYEQLGQSKGLDWKKIKTFLVDERVVPNDDNNSNTKLILHTLYGREDLMERANFCFPVYDEDVEKMRLQYEQNLQQILALGRPMLTIFGVGPDGHFASIFPGVVGSSGAVWSTQTEQFAVKERLTVAPEVIKKSAKTLILLAGIEKEKVLEELLNGSKSAKEFPAKMLLALQDVEILFCRE